MKIGTKIKVIASNPHDIEQEKIDQLIGKEFSVVSHWKQEDNRESFEDGEIQVHSDEFNGIICLNKDEYVEL